MSDFIVFVIFNCELFQIIDLTTKYPQICTNSYFLDENSSSIFLRAKRLIAMDAHDVHNQKEIENSEFRGSQTRKVFLYGGQL